MYNKLTKIINPEPTKKSYYFKKSLILTICLFFIVATSFILEFSLVKIKSNLFPQTEETYTLKEANQITEKSKHGKTLYILTLDESAYIDKLDLKLTSKLPYTLEGISYTVTVNPTTEGEITTSSTSTYSDTYYGTFSKSTTNIAATVNSLWVTFDSSNEVTLDSLHLYTSASWNPYELLVIFSILLLVSLLVYWRPKLHWQFFVFSMIIGVSSILLIGTNTPGWDEHIHFQESYQTFLGSWTASGTMMRENTVPDFTTYEERQEVSTYLNTLDTTSANLNLKHFITYSKRAYIGQGLFLLFGNLVHMPATWLYMFGKFGSLFVYSILLAIAIKKAISGKIYIAAIGLFPTSLFLASTYTYDPFITGFLILGTVYMINELTPEKRNDKLDWKNLLIMILCICIGSFSKAIYVPLLLFILLFPKTKFYSKIQELLCKFFVVVICVTILSTFVLPVISTMLKNNQAATIVVENDENTNSSDSSDTQTTESVNLKEGADNQTNSSQEVENTSSADSATSGYASDPRGGNTSIKDQLNYIIAKPFDYTKLLLSSIFGTFSSYTFRDACLKLGHLGNLPESILFISPVFFFILAGIRPKEEKEFSFSSSARALNGILLFGIICLIWTSMYLAFTPVRASVINGVQGRYYIPLLFPIFFLFRNTKLKWNISSELYNRIILGILIILNGFALAYNLLPNCL